MKGQSCICSVAFSTTPGAKGGESPSLFIYDGLPVQECSISPADQEKFKKAPDVILDQVIEMQDLQTEIAVLTQQLEQEGYWAPESPRGIYK